MKTIKFSKCPIGKHKGERWPKLSYVDAGSPVVLIDVKILFGIVSQDIIEADTFPDWGIDEFNELLIKFYGFLPVCLYLFFEQGDYKFTTIRAYEWRKHKYYLDSIGKEFMVVET